ncbi:flagellar assembly protein FliW [Spirochaetota bacterium]
MQIENPRLGIITYEKDQVIVFNEGLYGFEYLKKYVIANFNDNSIFKYLQSIEDVNIAFVITEPENFMNSYILDVTESDIKELGIDSDADIMDYVIITIPEKLENITANLQGPLLVNKKTNTAKQVLSLRDDYTTKYRIIDNKITKKGS